MSDRFNALQEAINGCPWLYLREISEPVENVLRLLVEEARALGPSSDVIIGGTAIKDTRAIESAPDSPLFELLFTDYVAYAVRNESFARDLEGGLPSESWFCSFQTSPFLDFVETTTFAGEAWPGPYTHYSVWCLNHVIDVAATEEPTIEQLR